jgi:hypothetical protein
MSKVIHRYAPFVFPTNPPLPKAPPTDRPMLRVRLESAIGGYYNTFALADSGADACLFSLRAARFLKLNLATLPKATIGGIGNSANVTYYETISIDLGHGMRFETKAGFTQGMDQVGIGLLGHLGFFENYNVEFRHRQRIFTIEPA